jgi:cysteine desulfurase
VLAAASDHAAVLSLGPALMARRHELVQVPVTAHGDLHPEDLFELLGKDVRVVSILHGHNELGTLSRVEDLVGVVRHVAPEAHVHVDLVQAYGKIDFDLDQAGVDSVAVSAHKLGGPRGIGFLALSSTARLVPLQEGGGQEEGMRGGTENVAGAVGLARAAERMLSHMDRNAAHGEALARRTFDALQAEFPDVERLGHPERRLPHLLSLRIPEVVGQTLQERVAARGLAVSTGSACHDGRPGGSRALAAIGLDTRQAREVVRISFGCETRAEEVEAALEILIDEAERLRALAAGRTVVGPAPKSARRAP